MKLPGFSLIDALEASGLAAIVAGVALITIPVAVIVAGVFAVAWANLHDIGHKETE